MRKYLFVLLTFVAACNVFAQRPNVPEIYGPKLKQFYQDADSLTTLHKAQKPVIGVSVSNTMKGTCTRSIELAGGIPFIVPETQDVTLIEETLSKLDGLIMSGGEDINPAYYGEEPIEQCGKSNDARDAYELLLLKKAMDRNIPVLGICRGLQLINVAMGGKLYQDLPTQHPSDIEHAVFDTGSAPVHEIGIEAGSVLQSVVNGQQLAVNSKHHQGIKQLAPELKITAWSLPDSVPEAIEAYPIRPIMGVQFHPELNAAEGDTTSIQLFEHLVIQASIFAEAKDIHSRIYSIDTHCDTPMAFSRGGTVGARNRQQVSIPKMTEGFLDAQFLAAFLSQKEHDDASMKAAVEKCQSIIDDIYNDVAKYPEYCGIARTEEEAVRLKAEGKKAFFIGIENGYGIGNDLSNIKKYYDQGVNYMTLCHSYDNAICNSSTHTADENKGLTDFGRKVVKEMNKVGMVIDLSHASMGTFWDVMKESKMPVVCTHSGAKDLFFHDRNLNDAQLRALAKNGGVIQICIFASYMSPDRTKTSIDDVVAHIDHCVKVAGIDHVGIGSDFDGGGGVLGCRGSNDMIRITVKLLEKGYTEEMLRKIWAGNFFRVLNTCRAAEKK